MAAKILNWIRFRTNTSPTKPAQKVHADGIEPDWFDAIEREIINLRQQGRNADAAAKYRELCNADPTNWEYLSRAAVFEADTMANYPQAIEYNEKALALQPTDLPLANTLRNLGSVYERMGDYAMSLEYYLKSVDVRRRIYGEVHQDIALGYNHIGGVYHALANYEKAHEYYIKALNINLKVYGENHPSVASNYNNGGILYYETGDYANAERCYLKSLDIKRRVFGEVHPTVANSYYNMGAVYQARGRYEEALQSYRTALDIRLSLFGQEAYVVGLCYDKIGILQHMMGDNPAALESLSTARDIFSRTLGESHPESMALRKMISDIQLLVNDQFTPPGRRRY